MTNNTPAHPILDSGDRTQFPTGAVRDMHEGKDVWTAAWMPYWNCQSHLSACIEVRRTQH